MYFTAWRPIDLDLVEGVARQHEPGACPCGFFVARDVVSPRPFEMVQLALSEDYERLRALLVEEPLRQLRRADAPMADLLAAALSGNADDGCDSEQVARVATAVQLSLVGLEQLWGKRQ